MRLNIVYGIKVEESILKKLRKKYKNNKDILLLINHMNYIGYSLIENNLYLKEIYFENGIFEISDYIEKFKIKVNKKDKKDYNDLINFLKDIFNDINTNFLDKKPKIMFILEEK